MVIILKFEIKTKNPESKFDEIPKSHLLLAIDEYKDIKEVVILGKFENDKMKNIPELSLV